MKIFRLRFVAFVAILGLTGTHTSPTIFADADFFNTNITQSGKTTAHELFQNLKIREVTLKSASERTRLAQTQFFLAQIKKEAERRYGAGEMDFYAIQDIKNELSYLVFSMNEYFANTRSYERNKNSDFKNLALQNLNDAQMSYDRLKAATLRSARNGH